MDIRRPTARRFYFQCVLAKDTLWSRGVESFASNQTQQYYLLLLHNKLAGLSRGNFKRKVKELPYDLQKDFWNLCRSLRSFVVWLI